MSSKLIYFPVRGRAEAIRFLLHDNGIKFEEQVITKDTWPDLKPKMAFGQIPCFVDGDLQLVQSVAILRYLARKHGFYGENDMEKYQIDMICDGQEDLRKKYLAMIYHYYEEGKPKYIEDLPGELEKFEILLKANNEGKGFFVGKKISFVDYLMLDLLDAQETLAPGALDGFPHLKGFYERMLSREGIARYRQTDECKNRKFNGNGKQ